jgi:hypothetical protein
MSADARRIREEKQTTALLKNELCYAVLIFVEDKAVWGLSYKREIIQMSQ